MPPALLALRFTIYGLILAYLALSAYLVFRTATLQPYSDMFDWLARYLGFTRDGGLAGYLLAPHNFHRLAWTFGAIALDARWLGGQGYGLAGFNILCLYASAAMLAWQASRVARSERRMALGGLAAMLALMAGNLLDASILINGTYAQSLVFSILAMTLASGLGPARANLGRVALAVAALVAAALGNAVGFAALPAMIFCAWQGGAKARTLIALTSLGLATAALYAWHDPLGEGSGWTLARLANALVFGLSYLGLPWTRVLPSLGWLAGLTMLGLSTVVILGAGRGEPSKAQRLATAFIIFSVCTALMAALVRADQGPPTDPPLRYGLLLAPLHVGLLMHIWPRLETFCDRRSYRSDAILAAAMVLMLGQQLGFSYVLVRVTDANKALISDFADGKRTAGMTPTVHPDLDHAAAIRADLDRLGLYQAGQPKRR